VGGFEADAQVKSLNETEEDQSKQFKPGFHKGFFASEIGIYDSV
jgi:hypothetical protein